MNELVGGDRLADLPPSPPDGVIFLLRVQKFDPDLNPGETLRLAGYPDGTLDGWKVTPPEFPWEERTVHCLLARVDNDFYSGMSEVRRSINRLARKASVASLSRRGDYTIDQAWMMDPSRKVFRLAPSYTVGAFSRAFRPQGPGDHIAFGTYWKNREGSSVFLGLNAPYGRWQRKFYPAEGLGKGKEILIGRHWRLLVVIDEGAVRLPHFRASQRSG